ncbi:MAG TPA: hypothetical protein VH331_19060 [Allosphingosinicella sp.]|jgi:hypothetical protein|nr:hypothetical protein [Allosphingosinicella sp.]
MRSRRRILQASGAALASTCLCPTGSATAREARASLAVGAIVVESCAATTLRNGASAVACSPQANRPGGTKAEVATQSASSSTRTASADGTRGVSYLTISF